MGHVRHPLRVSLAHSRRGAHRPTFLRNIGLASTALTALVFPLAVHAQASGSPYTTGYRWDADRRIVGVIQPDPDGATTTLSSLAKRYTYDNDGQLIKTEEGRLAAWQAETVAPANWAGFTVIKTIELAYDAGGRVILETVKGSDGVAVSVTQKSYDAADRPDCTAIRMNPAVFASLPAACTPGTAGSDGPDRISKSVYDANGKEVQVRKAVGTSIEQAYATYSYTANGNREYVIDANGNRARFVFDGYDRVTNWYFPSPTLPSAFNGATQATALATAGSASTTDYEQYTLDANGNRTALRQRGGQVIGYSYDAVNRMTVKDMPGTADDVTFTYDLRGLQRSALFSSGQGISSAWDKGGRQTSSTNTMGGVTRTISYGRDKDGNRTSVTHPDGQYFSYGYDYADRLTSIKENGATVVASITFDAPGHVQNLTRGAVPTDFGYDAASRISSMADNPAGTAQDVTTSFTYNPASQIRTRGRIGTAYTFTGYTPISRSYTPNGLNQYSAAGGVSFGYDTNGNLTSDGTTSYTYDAENRLISTSSGAALAYDPLGRLWQVSNGATTTRFLYDGDELVAEYDGANTLLRRYVHGGGDDDPLVWYEGAAVGSTNRRSLVADYQGSIMSIADSAGNVIASNGYDEYGIPNGFVGTGTANTGRFQYTGQIWIPELNLYHYKARLYSPTLGRFLQTDPVGYKDQVNLYAYVGNDPIDRRDPTGEKVLVAGTPEERKELIRAIVAVAQSNKKLHDRILTMINSKHVHTVEFAKGNTVSHNEAFIPYYSENGSGSDSASFIRRQSKLNDGTPNDIGATIAHELFGHGYEADRGIADRRIDATGIGNNEISATQAENLYREKVPGLPVRTHYGRRPVPPSNDE